MDYNTGRQAGHDVVHLPEFELQVLNKLWRKSITTLCGRLMLF